MTNKRIKAFIFDLDGVITDTAEYHYQAWQKLADEENIPFCRKDNEKLLGVSRRKSLELLLNGRQVTEEKMTEMMNRKNQYYVDLIKQITKDDILPNVKEVLMTLRRMGYKIALGSASKNARCVVANLGITDLFDTICDGYSAEKTKPAPDLFLNAAWIMGTEPESCIVVEDAEAGIDAALNANMIAVGIGSGKRLAKAHYCYPSMKEFCISEIIS